MSESQDYDPLSEADALPPGMASAAHGEGYGGEAASPRAPGLIRGLLAALLDSIKTRLDLAAVEAEIYLVYVAQLLLWGFAAVACVLLAVVFALTAVVIAVWQTHRVAGLLGSMGVLLLLAVICGLVGARIFRGRPPLLAGTLGQFEHDQHRMAGREGGP
ncbi:MAG: phage holin family protein [Steroidobacteraceae bacterium]